MATCRATPLPHLCVEAGDGCTDGRNLSGGLQDSSAQRMNSRPPTLLCSTVTSHFHGKGTYGVFLVVHTLCQDGAEGDGGQSPWLLAHSPDLQEGPERWDGKGFVTVSGGSDGRCPNPPPAALLQTTHVRLQAKWTHGTAAWAPRLRPQHGFLGTWSFSPPCPYPSDG